MTQLLLILKVRPQTRRSDARQALSLHLALPKELTPELREGLPLPDPPSEHCSADQTEI